MEIKIIDTIKDPFLKSEWERLERECDIFPQSTYHWCMTWWKYLSGRRSLHVVMAVNDDGNAEAIAPLCIERSFGVPVLRSFPIHFGDFCALITSDSESSSAAISTIMDYMASNKMWRWVRFDQVSETNRLSKILTAHGYRKKRITGCVVVNVTDLQWDEYLKSLRRDFSRNIRRRLKRIEEMFKSELILTQIWDDYEVKFVEMVEMHKRRWGDDYVPTKGEAELSCWKEAIKGQFLSGRMVYYELLFNDVPVAYRLGFLKKGIYYDWHTSYNPEYRNYSAGTMVLAFMIQQFINSGIQRINFMAGEYNWKMDWSPDQKVEEIYMFSSTANNIPAFFLSWYNHNFRDILKIFYHKTMRYAVLRSLSRYVISLRKGISNVK
jgi:CelD/BcsL family acetyltransferase involved in cellulose biosynthesis